MESSLKHFSFDDKMKEYSQLSMKLFKYELYTKYNYNKRDKYEIIHLRSNSEKFLKDYPVIMSTTYSLRRSLAEDVIYDFVIIDESSQVDLATGALALSCAKRAVIVGDLKQLPNVVDDKMKEKPMRFLIVSPLQSRIAIQIIVYLLQLWKFSKYSKNTFERTLPLPPENN